MKNEETKFDKVNEELKKSMKSMKNLSQKAKNEE